MKRIELTKIYLLVFFSSGVMACTPPQSRRLWEEQLLAADSLVDRGHYQDALRIYAELQPTAASLVEQRCIDYRLAQVEEHQGNWEAAIEGYLKLLENFDPNYDEDEYSARALFRIGLILYDQLLRREDALQVWWRLVYTFPNVDGPARRALDLVLVDYEESGQWEEAAERFEEGYHELSHTRMGANMLYWLAYILRHHLDQSNLALDLFRRLREEYFYSSPRNHGDWEIIDILHEQGEIELQLQLLRSIAAEPVDNIFFGSDAGHTHERAAFRIPQLYYEELDDPRGAIKAYQEFLDIWRFSLLRYEAAFRIIQILDELGDSQAVIRRSRQFLVDFSESRYVDEVWQILESYEQNDHD